MKKTAIALFVASVTILAACKKDRDTVSQEQEATYPTITFTGGQFYSINTGGSLPTVAATGYDSTLGESYPVEIRGSEEVDNTTPGLYIITARSTNRYGFYSEEAVYIAVTDVPDATNLGGPWERTTGEPVNVTKLARGLYMTDDVGGAAALEVPAVFVHLNDTTIDFPPQPTLVGTLQCTNEELSMAPGDTAMAYVVRGSGFGTAVRVFNKQ